jgi:hypothetical protein
MHTAARRALFGAAVRNGQPRVVALTAIARAGSAAALVLVVLGCATFCTALVLAFATHFGRYDAATANVLFFSATATLAGISLRAVAAMIGIISTDVFKVRAPAIRRVVAVALVLAAAAGGVVLFWLLLFGELTFLL